MEPRTNPHGQAEFRMPRRDAHQPESGTVPTATPEQKATKKDIPSFIELFRVSLLHANQYATILMPVVQIGVSLVLSVLTKGNENGIAESQKPAEGK